MAELWAARRWRRLLNLIDQLPGASRLAEAIALDEEHMEQIVAFQEAHPESRGPSGPRISEYDPVVERLDLVVDGLGQVLAAQVAAGGGRPPKMHPQPRPRTAYDDIKHRRRSHQHESLMRRLLRREA